MKKCWNKRTYANSFDMFYLNIQKPTRSYTHVFCTQLLVLPLKTPPCGNGTVVGACSIHIHVLVLYLTIGKLSKLRLEKNSGLFGWLCLHMYLKRII